MANFTAADIKGLREQTGAGMMDFKKALDEADGDTTRPSSSSASRASRASPSARAATRPTASSPRTSRTASAPSSRSTARPTSSPRASSSALAQQVLDQAVGQGRRTPTSLLESEIEPGKTVQDAARRGQRGHRREDRGPPRRARRGAVRRQLPAQDQPRPAPADRRPGRHRRRRRTSPATSRCTSPRCRRCTSPRGAVPADVVEKERRIAEETAREEGKPEAALPRIVEGRVNGFFKENVLLEQAFAKDQKKTVAAVLKEAGVAAVGFARFRVGA